MNGTSAQTATINEGQVSHDLDTVELFLLDETPKHDAALCAGCRGAESIEDLCLGCYVSVRQ